MYAQKRQRNDSKEATAFELMQHSLSSLVATAAS
jgi:hypothetical protein